MKKKSLILIFLIFPLLFSGCILDNTLDKAGYANKQKIEKEFNQLKKEYDQKLDEQTNRISSTKDSVIQGKDKQIGEAANSFYAADLVFDTIKDPDRKDIITNNYVNEGWTALGNRMPSYEKMQEINQRLKDELDETKTTLEDLRKNHNKALEENKTLADNTVKLEKDLQDEIRKKAELEREYQNQLLAKQTELNEANNRIIAYEKAKADDREAIKEAKTKGSTVLGLLAIACLAGAIFSPVFKEKLGILSGIFGFAAIAIWFIQPWHVAAVAGVLFLGVIGWALVNYNKERKAATSTYRALEEIKTKSKDTWEKDVKPHLDEWSTKYVKKDGKIEKVPDVSITNHIDKRLMEVEDK